jgi:FSR family fosmidomycin resistance protein-like MFS transporter
MVQSLIPAIYPILKDAFHLDFGQIGLITLMFQITASLLQPVVGFYTDKKAQPYSLAAGMGFTLIGLLLLSIAPNFGALLLAAALVGMGSSVFHPESARVARMASGGQHGLAQSVFQVGGNAGSSLGPLLAAFIVLPRGQSSIAWFSVAALLGMTVLTVIGSWYKQRSVLQKQSKQTHAETKSNLSSRTVFISIVVLVALIFSKYFYLASLTSYYTFYLITKFHVSVQSAQLHLFLFLGAVAAGTLIGGPVGDRIGRKYVIWCSILGILPFTLILPYRNYRSSAGLCFFGDPGLCAGTGAGANRPDLRHLLRTRFWNGRNWRGAARQTSRRYGHQLRLSRVFVSPRYRSFNSLFA